MCIVLLEHLALPANGELELLGQRVNNRHSHPVQTTRHFITVVVELSAGMQHGHDDFSSRDPFLMHLGRYPTAIVRHGDGFSDMDSDFDGVTVSCQGFINRIIHQLEDHMVQPGTIISVSDVHTRSLSNRIKAFEHLNAVRVIVRRVLFAHGDAP